jgi:hypothetical protein
VSASTCDPLEHRLLILAPVGRDAALVEALLGRLALACLACPDIASLAKELERGAAAILVTEEALARSTLAWRDSSPASRRGRTCPCWC